MTRQHACLLSGSSWDLVWLQMSYSIPSNTERNWMSTRQLVSQNIFWGHHGGLGNSSKFFPGFLLLTWMLLFRFYKFSSCRKKRIPPKMFHIALVSEITVHWWGKSVIQSTEVSAGLGKQLGSKCFSYLYLARLKSCWKPVQVTVAGLQ